MEQYKCKCGKVVTRCELDFDGDTIITESGTWHNKPALFLHNCEFVSQQVYNRVQGYGIRKDNKKD